MEKFTEGYVFYINATTHLALIRTIYFWGQKQKTMQTWFAKDGTSLEGKRLLHLGSKQNTSEEPSTIIQKTRQNLSI